MRFEEVYKLVKMIPKGKVTTYGQIGKILHMSPRVVGYALHANKDKNTPCHRVVNVKGRIAPNYAFGGHKIQKEMLEKEGVKFLDQLHVDLEKYLEKDFKPIV